MRLISDGSQGPATAPSPVAAVGTPGYAYQNAPGSGGSVSNLPPQDFNIILAELMSILSAAGVAPDNTGANTAQVLASLRILGLRVRLQGTTTLYVATTGNDSNPGTSAAPFATPQGAWNYIMSTLDLANQAVVIDIAAGTYVGNVICYGTPIGFGPASSITFVGNTSAPDSTVLQANSGDCFSASDTVKISIQGVKFSSSAGNGISALYGSAVYFSSVDFGACAMAHAVAADGALQATGNYQISGNAAEHWEVTAGGNLTCIGQTITLDGTPAFGTAFAAAIGPGYMGVSGNTFSGSATGARYLAELNGVINTAGGGSTYLPGGSAGSTSTGGVYA